MLDGGETGIESGENSVKLGIFVTAGELGGHGKQQGNLEIDLSVIDAVEDAVEAGVEQGLVELVVQSGL